MVHASLSQYSNSARLKNEHFYLVLDHKSSGEGKQLLLLPPADAHEPNYKGRRGVGTIGHSRHSSRQCSRVSNVTTADSLVIKLNQTEKVSFLGRYVVCLGYFYALAFCGKLSD